MLSRRPWLAAAGAYVAIASLMGRQVLGSLGSAIASDPGDPVLNAAILAWNATHLPWTDAWFQFPIFHPTADALTLSEHLLGVSVVATPIYWLTGSPAVAYNLTLLLSYPLSALAMYALVWRLTRSSSAAFVSGLAFAFAPYRTSQLPHIQMLAMFWAPLALLGLHAFADHQSQGQGETARHGRGSAEPRWSRLRKHGRWGWLALFAVCWALQGAANGYMLVYFSVLVAGWVLWFLIARGRWRDAALVAVAGAVAALPLVPILYRYFTAQRRLGLSRNLGEIASFGADIAAPLCAPPSLAFWGWLRVACAPEGELFVGVALIALCLAGAFASRPWRRGDAELSEHASAPRLRGSAVRRGVGRLARGVALAYFGIAVSVLMIGPWQIDLGWFRASASSADKPLSTALALLLIAWMISHRFRAAVMRGSTPTFYLWAALVCWVLSWGPFPRAFGTAVLYQAPYAWLLQLPGVGALRVPARFWMMTVLCLSVLAGLVVADALRRRAPRTSAIAVAIIAAGLLADVWATMPVAPLPPPVADAGSLRAETVLVQPIGRSDRDVGTVYHAVDQGFRAVNGFSGYEPPYYEALRTLAAAGDSVLLEPFLRLGTLAVVDENGALRRMPSRTSRAQAPVPQGTRLAARGRDASCSPEGMSYATDGDIGTRWVCGVQAADQQITFDLGRVAPVGSVVHALGALGADFPRQLTVETSTDGASWEPAWEGSPAAGVLVAAMEAPRLTRLVLPFTPRPAQYVRLRQTGRHERNYWSISEFEAWSGSGSPGE
jgi:hypothetical protein